MKNPLKEEQIESLVKSFDDEEEKNKYLTERVKRFEDIYNGLLTTEEIVEGAAKDILYTIWNFKNADLSIDLSTFNYDCYNQIFDDDLYIRFSFGDFIVKLKKPLTYGEMNSYRKIISSTSMDDWDDIEGLKTKLGNSLGIFFKEKQIDNINSVGYEILIPFYSFTPILYSILLLYVNSLGLISSKKKK